MEHPEFIQLGPDSLSLDEYALDARIANTSFQGQHGQFGSQIGLSAPGLALHPATPFDSDFPLDTVPRLPSDAAPSSLQIMSRSSTYAESLFSLNDEIKSEADPHSLARTPSPALSISNSLSRTSSPASAKRVRKPRAMKPAPVVDETFVKRPLNSFMLYRKDKQHDVPTNNHQSISRIIGDMWRKESADVKAHYDQLAREERERHALQYPGYKFQPRPQKTKDKLKEKKSEKSTLKSSLSRSSDCIALHTAIRPSQPDSAERSIVSEPTFSLPDEMPQPYSMHQGHPDFHYYMRNETMNPQSRGVQLPLEYAHYSSSVDCFLDNPYTTQGTNSDQNAMLRQHSAPTANATSQMYPTWQLYDHWAPEMYEHGLKTYHYSDTPIYQRSSPMPQMYAKDNSDIDAGCAEEDFYSYHFRCQDTQAGIPPSFATSSWELDNALLTRQFEL